MKCRFTEFEACCKRCRFYVEPNDKSIVEIGYCVAHADKAGLAMDIHSVWRDRYKGKECERFDPVRDVEPPRKPWWRRLLFGACA